MHGHAMTARVRLAQYSDKNLESLFNKYFIKLKNEFRKELKSEIRKLTEENRRVAEENKKLKHRVGNLRKN